MKSVCTLLGLSAEADEASVHAAVTKLQNRCATLEPLATENTTLKNRVTELETGEVASLLEGRGIKPEDARHAELAPVLTGMKNREQRVKFLDTIVPKTTAAAAGSTAATEQKKLTNRGAGNPATDTTEPNPEKAKADKILNRCRELQKTGLKFQDAYAEATREAHAQK